MTLADFKAAIARSRLSVDGKATYGALLVLVDGKKRTTAAAEAGCSNQAIARAIGAIARATKTCPYCGTPAK